MKARNSFIIALLTLVCSCSGDKVLNPVQFGNYLHNEKNGLLKTKVIAGVRYELQYLPANWLAYKENDEVPEGNIDTANEYANGAYFRLDIYPEKSQKNVIEYLSTNDGEYDNMLYYFNYKFKNDLKLLASGKEIKPAYCLSERNYNLNNKLTLTIGFPLVERNEDLKVSIDPQPLNTGELFFDFAAIDIAKVPQLKY